MAEETVDARRAVRQAMHEVSRTLFLPPQVRSRADYDGPLDIGHGQTCSQPRTVADMLTLLDVKPGQRVLDVGSGSGWSTALLAALAGDAGSVLGVEIEADLAATGAENLTAAGVGRARIRVADPAILGAPDQAPYDRILVSAEGPEVPDELTDQLARGGRMVLPVAGALVLVARDADGGLSTSRHGAYRFVPLR